MMGLELRVALVYNGIRTQEFLVYDRIRTRGGPSL